VRVIGLRFAMGATDVVGASAYMVDERSGAEDRRARPILYSR
jgi:hypothetical protein